MLSEVILEEKDDVNKSSGFIYVSIYIICWRLTDEKHWGPELILKCIKHKLNLYMEGGMDEWINMW